MFHYPRVDIEFCTKCRWNLRAAWYAQELLSTFGNHLVEVAMAPGDSGVFQVRIKPSENVPEILLWDRKTQGFPDSKDLKQLVRDVIDPERSLGHSDRKPEPNATSAPSSSTPATSTPAAQCGEGQECKDCER